MVQLKRKWVNGKFQSSISKEAKKTSFLLTHGIEYHNIAENFCEIKDGEWFKKKNKFLKLKMLNSWFV